MGITVGHWIIAETSPQTVILQGVVGAFELQFPIRVRLAPKGTSRCEATLFSARVKLQTDGRGEQDVGSAAPKIPVTLEPGKGLLTDCPVFHLPLSLSQITRIEELRNGTDLTFSLSASGRGIDGEYTHQVFDTWRFFVPQSDWILQLRNAGALDVLLVEVPMPLSEPNSELIGIKNSLVGAQRQFVLGNYSACVSSCRLVLDELGNKSYGEKWAGPALARLCADRDKMGKVEREIAIGAVVRHYTHPAHHSESDGGGANYDQSEAKFLLTLTAAIVAKVWSR